MSIMRDMLLWGSQNRWLSERLPRYGFMKTAVKRFMPGERIDEALQEAARLQKNGAGAIVTLLGENLRNLGEAEGVTDHYLEAMATIALRSLDTVISVKPTQLGLDLNEQVSYANLEKLVYRAEEFGTFVWIDMEGSAYTDITLDQFRRIRKDHDNVGLAMQAYLYRTENDLECLMPMAPAVRLVKGAYAESSDMAWPGKKDVDANYLKLARRFLQKDALEIGARAAFATHDERLVRRIIDEAQAGKAPQSAYEFQMLYGIGREMQKTLVDGGYRLKVLISYGAEWFPWYMRRLAERPANVWFVLRNMVS